VLFLTDDQDEFLGGWTPMVKTQNLLAAQGMRASNWFIHTPVCCPSRGELLSGRYFHNVRNPTPSGGCMHLNTDKVNPASFATYLNKMAGYSVAWFGKHMNSCPHAPPPGFDCPTCYWFTNGGGNDIEPGGYLNATFNDFKGGVAVSGSPYHQKAGTYVANTNGEFAGYTTSIIANKSIQWVCEVGAANEPFFVAVASKGPHVPATPAPWYATAFSDRSAPRTPDYNASKEQLSGHHALIANQEPITEEQGQQIDELFRNRWRTLLSIDDAIEGMVQELSAAGVLERTYFLITSDHGFNLGQHRLPSCKLNVYDHDLRIPMVIKGPGIKPGTDFQLPASNVDVGPTILGLAGIDSLSVSPQMDGRSIAPLIIDASDPAVLPSTSRHLQHLAQDISAPAWRQHHFVEYYSLGKVVRTGHPVDDPDSNTYRALRFTSGGPVGNGNMLYAEFTALKDWNFTSYSFVEIFDMDKDPHQLTNLAPTVSDAVKSKLHDMLQAQWECAGATCEAGQLAPLVV
jgi:N-acetylglucosamine-6-sulfatase